MSEFTSQGTAPFPNLHSDAQEILRVVEWSDEGLEYKLNQYGEFMQRQDIQKRARTLGDFILDRLIFDQACRDGVYDISTMPRLEDEVCGE